MGFIMSQSSTRFFRIQNAWTWIAVLGIPMAGIAGMYWGRSQSSPTTPKESHDTEIPREMTSALGAQLPESQWESSGIQIAKAETAPFSKMIRLTGKVSLNEDRIAHIYPTVEGTVNSVTAQLGQTVLANDPLVVIHSREIGKAKLEHYQAKLEWEMAQLKDRLQAEIAKNTRELLVALRKNEPILEIETRFRSRGMGDFRERLLLGYSNFLKSQADVQRLEEVSESGAISAKQLLAARSNLNADQATFQSRLEQIEYELTTSQLLASQATKEAETRVAVASTNLRILGCSEDDIHAIDPVKQGEAISNYWIRAPFEGTVISKDIALREQVRTTDLIFSIADLSTVWITADVYEEHVPLLGQLQGKTLLATNEAWPERHFEAKVFYTGEIMDESTRTIGLRAVVANDSHLLKPGMFVQVKLPDNNSRQVLQVPNSAVLEHQGTSFVFVHEKGDRFVRRDVKLGAANEKSIVIESGLEEGTPIVVQGGFILKSKMLADLMGEE